MNTQDNTTLILRAAEMFDLDPNDVESTHLMALRRSERHLKEVSMVGPLRTYTVDESGVVEPTGVWKRSLELEADLLGTSI